MVELHSKWLELMHEYDEIWRDQVSVTDSKARSRLNDAKKVELELSTKAINLPCNDKKLAYSIFESVVAARSNPK